MPPEFDHYQTLQVSPAAEVAVIKASYRALIQKYHPDRYRPVAEAELMTRRLNAAYAVLGDPDRRATYDEERAAAASSWAAREAPPPPPRPATPPPVPPHAQAPAGTPTKTKATKPGCLWVVITAICSLAGAKLGAAVAGAPGALIGALFSAAAITTADYLWRRARAAGVGAAGVGAALIAVTALLCVLGAAIAAVIMSATPSRSGASPAPAAAQGPSWTPVTTVPSDSFVAKDQALADRLQLKLPREPGAKINPDLVWETRQRMFLSLPENAHLYATAVAFSAWEKGMQEAADDAATLGYELDDYQVMEAGRVRARY